MEYVIPGTGPGIHACRDILSVVYGINKIENGAETDESRSFCISFRVFKKFVYRYTGNRLENFIWRSIMETVEIKLRDEYIKLGQALKAAGIAQSGVDAKYMIQDGEVLVNGETELQRGKKLHDGDVAVCRGITIRIVK